MDVLTLKAAKKFTEETSIGLGALKGAPCTVKSTSEDANGNTIVTLEWTGTDGTKRTKDVKINKGSDGVVGRDGQNGRDGASAYEIAIKNGFNGTEEEWLASLKGKDGINGDSSNDGGDIYLNINSYSLEEKRIGTWIDGKPLYRKVYETTVPVATATTLATGIIPHRISNLESIKTINGFFSSDPTNPRSPVNPIPIFLYTATTNTITNSVRAYFNGSNLAIENFGTTYGGRTCYLVVEYTKTTD